MATVAAAVVSQLQQVIADAGAVGLRRGGILPRDGPSEWVIGAREHYRVRVAEAAATLAELHLARHDPSAAAAAAAAALRSLDVDPCRDASWRLLLAASVSSTHKPAFPDCTRAFRTAHLETAAHNVISIGRSPT